ncbi:hypothetical protein F5876DRAFT_38817 [Lentinula aff. lateritia]|uniref:Uncharacterized protein n=1 Tax=Lentinula aff. lateritia TaxID=2804960 RepID=A0ACC1U4C7_9AGAR|nr:hypothetical protein F5876DRAFT_38817 [Lentinula aff. lateritia]
MQRTGLRLRDRLRSPYAYTKNQWYSTQKPKSPHAQWYSDVLPAMIPIFLLGSAVYLGLQLAQTRLSHERYMIEARERVETLESQIDAALQRNREREPESTHSKSPSDKPSWRFW